MLAWAGISTTLLVWVILRERDPIRVVLDYVLLILNFSFLLYNLSPSIDLSFYSLLLIIVYASALAILFGLIVMIYTLLPSQGSSLPIPFFLPFFSTVTKLPLKTSYKSFLASNGFSLFFFLLLGYYLLKFSLSGSFNLSTPTYLLVEDSSNLSLVSILYHHIYDLSLNYNSINLLLLVLLLLVAMLMLILVLI